MPWMWMPLRRRIFDGPDEVGHGLLLLHVVEARGIDGFEPDVHRVTAGLFHEPDELEVAGDVGSDLGRPLELEPLPDHGLEELLGPLGVGREIVVVEEDGGPALVVPRSSSMMFSVERKRYFFPNMPVTEQKEQSKGQPRDVWTGIGGGISGASGSCLRSEKSGYGITSRSFSMGSIGLWTTRPSIFRERLGIRGEVPAAFPGVDEGRERPLPFARG